MHETNRHGNAQKNYYAKHKKALPLHMTRESLMEDIETDSFSGGLRLILMYSNPFPEKDILIEIMRFRL